MFWKIEVAIKVAEIQGYLSDEGNKISKFTGGKGLSNEDLNRYRNQQIIREYLFNNFPEFVGIFQNNITFQKNCIENAKILLGINEIDINNFMDFKAYTNELYKKTWNRTLNESEKNSGVSTVGEISEKLVEGAFSGLIDNINFFNSKGNDAVKSYGDFVLMCLPNNLWLSVKSGYSRERLLASGFSNDILGVGFFEDFEEFTSESKNRNLKKVGFLAIYCPDIPVSRDQIENGTNTYDLIQDHFKNSHRLYDELLNAGVAREQARMVLPLATTTKIHMTGSIRSWIHFLELRDDEHAQKEIQLVAKEIKKHFKEQFPIISNALKY